MKVVKWSLQYAWLSMKHKYFVFIAGLRIGVPIKILLLHDISKFSMQELPHYGRQFFGDKSQPDAFARAWLHHQNHNKHHWEYWIQRTGHDKQGSKELFLDMPAVYIKEMIADWFGASRAYEGKWPTPGNWKWLEEPQSSFRKLRVSPQTDKLIRLYLHKNGFYNF